MIGRVFVVEDDPLVRRAVTRLFRTAGYDVASYERVDAFLTAEQPPGPACVVLDLHFPVGNGFDVLEHLAAGDTPLAAVVLTAHGDVPTTVRAMKRGAVELLEKPIDNARLLAAVEEGLARSARRAEELKQQRRLEERRDSLSPRQREVFELVVAGIANKVIAARLGISEKTVKVHRAEVMRRMGADSLAELVRTAAALEAGAPEEP
ncbi:MAG: response regulator transcription factor [Thermoanaerobaculia bacterium]